MKKIVILLLAVGLLLSGCGQTSTTIEPLEPPPELYEKIWISPGKVEVGNFFPGARAEYPITIHNGNDEPTEFSIAFQVPGSTAEGYEPAPSAVEGWMIIEDPSPVLEAKETREVLIAVVMPEDAEAPAKWEFWIAVKDITQTGMVQTELACRWLVEMSD